MRICYLGNFREAFCTETHVGLTLEDLGHEVIRMQEDVSSIDQIVEACKGCGLFLWTRTYGWLKGDGFEMLRRIREMGVPSASFHLDYYFAISRQSAMPQDAFWFTDYVFQPDGDHLDDFKALDINAFWSPPAVYRGGCYMLDRPKVHEIVFVGTVSGYHSEWPWRQELVRFLQAAYGSRFEVFPKDHAVREAELNELYASTKVVVGDSIMADRNRTYTTDRIFETTGRGGFIVYPDIEWVKEQFEGSLATYHVGDLDGLKDQIDFYLHPSNDPVREVHREICHEITKERHTYHNRLKAILGIIISNEKAKCTS